jgi:hypothetical protein
MITIDPNLGDACSVDVSSTSQAEQKHEKPRDCTSCKTVPMSLSFADALLMELILHVVVLLRGESALLYLHPA